MIVTKLALYIPSVILPALCIYTFSVTFNKLRKERIVPGILVHMLLCAILSFVRIFLTLNFPSYIGFLTSVFDFLFVIYVCKASFRRRVLSAAKAILINFSLLFILLFFYVLLISDKYSVDTTGIWANVTSIVAYLVELELFFTIIIIRNMKRNSLASKYLMLSLTIALSMALTLFLSPMILEPSYYDSEMVFVIHIVSGSILTLSIFTLLRGLISIWEQNYRLKVIVEKTTMEEEYYKSIQESLKQISIIRHDYKNHLGIIELLLEKKDYDKAKEYVDKINRETIHATEDLVSSPSPVVSSIVAAKSSVLQEYGGTLNFSSSFGGIFFDDFDVVSILSNILDNAIRAASAADDKDVDLSINQFGDNLMIECTNHFSGTLIKSNGQFLTTKSTDKMLHGLGLESVRQTAAKLHGFVKIQDTHDTFTINVCLPNIMPKQQS